MEFGLSGSFADTLVNVSTWISQWWNALVSESGRACQHNFDSFLATAPPRGIRRRETTAQRDGASVRAIERSRSGTDRSLPAAERENLGSGERCYGLGAGVGRGLAVI
jgi:hypothetical protein